MLWARALKEKYFNTVETSLTLATVSIACSMYCVHSSRSLTCSPLLSWCSIHSWHSILLIICYIRFALWFPDHAFVFVSYTFLLLFCFVFFFCFLFCFLLEFNLKHQHTLLHFTWFKRPMWTAIHWIDMRTWPRSQRCIWRRQWIDCGESGSEEKLCERLYSRV